MANNGATGNDLAYAEILWKSADALRGQIDAAEYKHVVLGLLFLKYISDSFEARRVELEGELKADGISGPQIESLLENRDEYTAERVFWVPPEARWQSLQSQAARTDVATLIDDAILAIERDNPNLKGKLPRDYARRGIAPEKMKELIDLIADIGFKDDRAKARDTLGRVYEYFLGKFAQAEGKLGGEFFTPRCIVRLLVEMRAVRGPRLAASTTPVAVRPACSCSPSASWKPTADRRPTSPSSARSPIPPPAAGGIEPGHPRYRGQPWLSSRRQHPAQPAPRPQGRLHPRQPAVQHLGLVGQAAGRRHELEPRYAALRQRQLRLDTALHPPLGPAQRTRWRSRRFRHGQRLALQRFRRRGRNPPAYRRGRPGGLHRRAAGATIPDHYAFRQWRGEPAPGWWDDSQHGAWAYRGIPGFCKAETIEHIGKYGFVLTPGSYVGAEDVDSEIGRVPEGWEVKTTGESTHLTMGQSPPTEFYNESGEGLPFHQGVTDFGFRFPTHRVYCTTEGRITESGDVLLSVRVPVGRVNVADHRLVLGRGLAGLRHRSGRQSFLLQQICHVFAEEDAIVDETIYKAVTKRFLEQLPLLFPSKQAQVAFENLAYPLDDLIVLCEVESRRLAETRDLLSAPTLSRAASSAKRSKTRCCATRTGRSPPPK